MTATKMLGWIALVGLLTVACSTDLFGNRSGENETLVEAIDVAERVLIDDLARVFGDYTVTADGMSVVRCDPLEEYKGAYWVRITVPGAEQREAYDRIIDGRRGLSEVKFEGNPNRAAGFDIDGIGGQIAVFDHDDEDLRIAANTGCYGEGSWGVDDPYSLQIPKS